MNDARPASVTLSLNLSQLIPAAECGREAAKRAVVVPFDDMDVAADDVVAPLKLGRRGRN